MWKWVKTRGRAGISFLSDLGGALVFVVGAVGLIAAAVAGAVLLALDAFPQPYFTMLVFGIGLLGAGAALHFLRGPMSRVPVAPAAEQPTGRSPFERAAALEGQYHDQKAREEQRVLAERRALRWVREELLDNRRRIDLKEFDRLTDRHWRECEPTLLELENPEPHAQARRAYREIEVIENAETVGHIRVTTTNAIDEAVDSLGSAMTDASVN